MSEALPVRAAAPAPRDPAFVMRPERLAALQPCRLSVSRALVNRMIRERWDIRRARFEMDGDGVGLAIYEIHAPGRIFSFIAFGRRPDPRARTGRIIGRSWDMMGALIEGPATEAAIDAAREELPKLYRGRATPETLVWCRSNRSMRVFDATRAALASGRQPEVRDLAGVCYLMRNTGLDGNGTFGTRSFAALGAGNPLGLPLQAQMLCAYLMREYSCDMVEHLARQDSPDAVSLDPALRRFLGVGNGSALGLIFFVHKHPQLISAWIEAREKAIAAARALTGAEAREAAGRLALALRRVAQFRREDRMVYESFASSAEIAAELDLIAAAVERVAAEGSASAHPFDALLDDFEGRYLAESCETYLSALIDLVPDAADALFAGIDAPDSLRIEPSETCGALAASLRRDYNWALATDMAREDAYRFTWYKSESAEEPRRGAREEVPEARDLGLDVCGEAQALLADLDAAGPDLSVARFLMAHPAHRHLVARIQTLRAMPYHTPLANIYDAGFVPIDLVRLMNVGLHGIDKTRDFLQRNLRGVLLHGAPTPDDIRAGRGEGWSFPPEPAELAPVPEPRR